MSDQLDVLVLAAHPDDAEIGCGGTIARMVAAGSKVGVVDVTRGEAATRGDPETRAREAAAASRVLGLTVRTNLGLPDGSVRADDAATEAVVAVIRRHRPALLLAPLPIDAHPDHVAVADLARRAFFHSGLRKLFDGAGEPNRPRLLARYYGNDFAVPSFCVDVGPHLETKRAAIRCYASQFAAQAEGRAHYLRGLDPLERAEVRDRYFGALCGKSAAEPFAVDGPFALDAVALLIGVR
ncbi:MAG: bacillithiol biosynthesis deacetylase BshB1 [Planctomycetota bacterium]